MSHCSKREERANAENTKSMENARLQAAGAQKSMGLDRQAM
jgi:hypothetical protein